MNIGEEPSVIAQKVGDVERYINSKETFGNGRTCSLNSASETNCCSGFERKQSSIRAEDIGESTNQYRRLSSSYQPSN